MKHKQEFSNVIGWRNDSQGKSRKRYHFLQREFILANEATKVQMDNKILTNENASFLDIVYRVNLQVCMYV